MNNSWNRENPSIPPIDPSVSPLTKGGIKGGMRGNCGFTLLELMISIVILGIIILIIVGAMRLGFRSVDAGEKKIESLERIRASFNIMDSQIQSLIPLTYNEESVKYDEEGMEEGIYYKYDEEGIKKYYFSGNRESLQFTTNYSIWGGQRGYVIVAYRVLSEGNGKPVLYASENIIGMEGSRETKLLDAFDAIYFEYFYKDPTEEEGNWVEQWTDNSSIPEKIKLHLITGERDLSIIIPIRAKGSIIETLAPPEPPEVAEE